MWVDDFEKRWKKFADAANAVVKKASAISPASPDFQYKLLEDWKRKEVERKFDELRRMMQ